MSGSVEAFGSLNRCGKYWHRRIRLAVLAGTAATLRDVVGVSRPETLPEVDLSERALDEELMRLQTLVPRPPPCLPPAPPLVSPSPSPAADVACGVVPCPSLDPPLGGGVSQGEGAHLGEVVAPRHPLFECCRGYPGREGTACLGCGAEILSPEAEALLDLPDPWEAFIDGPGPEAVQDEPAPRRSADRDPSRNANSLSSGRSSRRSAQSRPRRSARPRPRRSGQPSPVHSRASSRNSNAQASRGRDTRGCS